MINKPILSSTLTTARTIAWLNLQGLPVLPVAPWQDYPRCRKGNRPVFTGKNPSFLGIDGGPHLILHRCYQSRLPRQYEIDRWFANPANGVMTMGGWGDVYWIDIDVKRYGSKQVCDRSVEHWLKCYPMLKETFIERTHSGGWRFAVKCLTEPGFTNFRFRYGPKHVGELLGFGRLTVLAPTIGPSGNSYESIQRVEPVLIESFGAIGIHSVRKCSVVNHLKRGDRVALNGAPHLVQVVSGNVLRILNGVDVYGDRSRCLLVAALELYGWVNWAQSMGVAVAGNPDSLLLETATSLGVETDRLQRILKGQPIEASVPAIYQAAGQEATLARWRRSLQHL